MRVTSHCANHPSKEAGQRCSSCGKWLCEACVQRTGSHVYCGWRCRVVGLARGAILEGLRFARRPLHPIWVLTAATAVSATLLTVIGLSIGELIALSRPGEQLESEPPPRPTFTAEILGTDHARVVRIEGHAGTRVLVLEDERPSEILTIGADGVSESPLPPSLDDGGSLRLVTLSEPALDCVLTAAPAPRPTAIPRPTTVSQPSATPSPKGRAVAVARPTPALSPPVLQLVADTGPYIALTFDGNSSSNRTGELLDLLHDLDLEVTLFVTGQFVERYPEVVRRAVLAGHDVGNHTFSHPHLTTYEQNRRHSLQTGVTRERFQNELRRTERAFKNATGRPMAPLWRAPFGEENSTLRGWALELGYLHVRWSSLEGASLDSRDWVADEHSSMYQNSSTMMNRLMQFPELHGGIVLMHLATNRDESPWEELPTFVESLRERGVAPTTVMKLLESSPTWRPWLHRASARHMETFGR
jgi:peptidoglycan/xylan/chitin deacetylase (PgdA/CDA1 family)